MKKLLIIALPLAWAGLLSGGPAAMAGAEDLSEAVSASVAESAPDSEGGQSMPDGPEDGGDPFGEALDFVEEKLAELDRTAIFGTSVGSLVSAAVSALFWIVYRKLDRKWKQGVEESEASSNKALAEISAKVDELAALVKEIDSSKDEAVREIAGKYEEIVQEISDKSKSSYDAFYEAASKLEAYSNTENRLAEIERLIRIIAESPLGVSTGLAREVADGK